MSFENLIGQEPAKTYLRRALQAGRLSHGYLFSGPPGVGKRTGAYAFAQLALCSQPPAPDEACGRCKSCHWFATRQGAVINHPDVIPLMTLKEREVPDADNPQQRHRERDEKFVGDHEAIIPLAAVQLACEQLHRSPMAGTKRVLIVPEAQRLCRGQAESANAFLKTLEEPPRASLIILTSSQPEGLIDTLVSRVQTVHFRRLSHAEVLTGLRRQKPNVPADEAELVAAIADGSIGRAIDFADGDLKHWRGDVNAGLNACDARNWLGFGALIWQMAQAEGERLYKAAEDIGDEAAEDEDNPASDAANAAATKTAAGWNRHVLLRLLALCEITFRDGLVFAATNGSPEAPLLQPNDAKLIETIAHRFGAEGCQQALQALQDAAAAARLYVRGDVCSRALAGRLREAMVG